MKILLTGASGYIGSHTALELLNANHEVLALGNFFSSVEASLNRVTQLAQKSLKFVKVDLSDYDSLKNVFLTEKFDIVVHMAAFKGVSESIENPLKFYSNNLVGSLNLLKACKEFGVRNFIFSSSVAVYGIPATLPILETDRVGYNLTNPYAETKYMFEKILMDLGNTETDWNIIILRLLNPVGAHPSGTLGEGPQGNPSNLMLILGQVALGSLQSLKINGDSLPTPDGTIVRDFVHVLDLAKAHVKAVEKIQTKECASTEIYNIGSGRGISLNQAVQIFEKINSLKIKTKIGPPRNGDVVAYYVSTEKAEKHLAWKTELSFEDACCDMWNWQRKNPQGYETRRDA